jgi:hypothetical protein
VGKMAHHPCHQNVKTIFNAEDVGNKCRERWGKIYNALGGKQQRRQKLPPPLARFPFLISGQFMYSLVQLPKTSRQIHGNDSCHDIISWNIQHIQPQQ